MALAKFRKGRMFKGRLFSNTIKIKLFVVDSQCYIPLDLNKIAGNVHLFKLHRMLTRENITLKKNWIWDVLQIDWTDICILQNDKEINLPITIVIPIYYKLKMRQLLWDRKRSKESLGLTWKTQNAIKFTHPKFLQQFINFTNKLFLLQNEPTTTTQCSMWLLRVSGLPDAQGCCRSGTQD